jgi:hypothetical protein
MRRATIKEAAELTGLTERKLSCGCKAGRYPHIEAGMGAVRHKYLFDMDRLEEALRKEELEALEGLRANERLVFGGLRRLG